MRDSCSPWFRIERIDKFGYEDQDDDCLILGDCHVEPHIAEDGRLGLFELEELEKLNAEYHAEDKDRARQRAELLMSLARELGLRVEKETTILDFGCGDGRSVYWLRKMGLKAFGADIVDRYESSLGQLRNEGIVSDASEVFKLISSDVYRIPFPDCEFDFVYSDQVFEHVHNYEQAISEIFRV